MRKDTRPQRVVQNIHVILPLATRIIKPLGEPLLHPLRDLPHVTHGRRLVSKDADRAALLNVTQLDDDWVPGGRVGGTRDFKYHF